MIDPAVPSAAVQIAATVLQVPKAFREGYPEAVVAALAGAGWLHPPEYVAALEAATRDLVATLAGRTWDARDPVVAALVQARIVLAAVPEPLIEG